MAETLDLSGLALGATVVLGLLGYLLAVLVRPEKF